MTDGACISTEHNSLNCIHAWPDTDKQWCSECKKTWQMVPVLDTEIGMQTPWYVVKSRPKGAEDRITFQVEYLTDGGWSRRSHKASDMIPVRKHAT